MGRKPLPVKLARSHRVGIMLTEDEAKRLEKAREKMGFATVSDLVRAAIDAFIQQGAK